LQKKKWIWFPIIFLKIVLEIYSFLTTLPYLKVAKPPQIFPFKESSMH
jgi:hypothetical protein